MILNYDQNMCCTALCLSEFNSMVDKSYYDTLPGLPIDMVFTHGSGSYYIYDPSERSFVGTDFIPSSYEQFSLALALLCVNFYSYCEGYCHQPYLDDDDCYGNDEWEEDLDAIKFGDPRFWWGVWEPGDLSTVFGFTSTGDNPDCVGEYLSRFGFKGQEISSSEKYPDSVVTLWAMPAKEFAEKSREIYDEAKKRYGKPIPEGETTTGVDEEAA